MMKKEIHAIRESKSDRTFLMINSFILVLLTFLIAYPLYFVVIASISDYVEINSGRVILWPRGFNASSYSFVFQNSDIWNGYFNTIVITIVGTSINLVLTFTSAYALSKSHLPWMRGIMLLITFTMFFGGGLIPTYLLVSSLGLRDSIWAMVLPGAVSAYNMILVRNYYQKNIPSELLQAAMIDGCDDMRMFRSIVLPLSTPMIATMALFYGVGHWNQYFEALLYLSKREMYPLQQVLREILLISTEGTLSMAGSQSEAMAEGATALAEMISRAETMKYAVIIVASVPVLVIYPFLQRYFMKGMLVGSIKG